MTDSGRTPQDALAILAEFFARNGYVRRQRADRLRAEGAQVYKKGEEIRFSANSVAELRLIRRSLREAGFTPGRPFRKGSQFRQPVYGIAAVQRFLAQVAPDCLPPPS